MEAVAEAMKRADGALYEAKANGRDSLVFRAAA
jgi:PleD family two-component response regulator